MVTVLEQWYPKNHLESTPLESLQAITEISRKLGPSDASILYHRADVQAVVERQCPSGETGAESFQCVQETSGFRHDFVYVSCPPQVR